MDSVSRRHWAFESLRDAPRWFWMPDFLNNHQLLRMSTLLPFLSRLVVLDLVIVDRTLPPLELYDLVAGLGPNQLPEVRHFHVRLLTCGEGDRGAIALANALQAHAMPKVVDLVLDSAARYVRGYDHMLGGWGQHTHPSPYREHLLVGLRVALSRRCAAA